MEHASSSGGGAGGSERERAKLVAETTQNFITFMDALKLKLRAKDQLHPLLSELMSSYSRSMEAASAGEGSTGGEGRARVLHW